MDLTNCIFTCRLAQWKINTSPNINIEINIHLHIPSKFNSACSENKQFDLKILHIGAS